MLRIICLSLVLGKYLALSMINAWWPYNHIDNKRFHIIQVSSEYGEHGDIVYPIDDTRRAHNLCRLSEFAHTLRVILCVGRA